MATHTHIRWVVVVVGDYDKDSSKEYYRGGICNTLPIYEYTETQYLTCLSGMAMRLNNHRKPSQDMTYRQQHGQPP